MPGAPWRAVRRLRSRRGRWLKRAVSSPFRDLRRLEPMSRTFGLDRGLPVDRWYIERFLARYASDIRGAVLEVGDDRYTQAFGSAESSDVLNLRADVESTTLVADLAEKSQLPEQSFDCIVCTQTLQFIYDLPAAIAGLHQMLKQGGVVLATVSGISQISRYDMERWGDNWRFTTLSARKLFEAAFGATVQVQSFGNVLAAVAFLEGLAAEELTHDELAHSDDDYQLLIGIRAVKEGRAS